MNAERSNDGQPAGEADTASRRDLIAALEEETRALAGVVAGLQQAT